MAGLWVPFKTTDSNGGYFRCQMSDLQPGTLDAVLIRRLQARDVLHRDAAKNELVGGAKYKQALKCVLRVMKRFGVREHLTVIHRNHEL
jgi:hypothetical protein